ncbi:MAG: lamin tail domain-containing protein [Akkermansiaceae bacterium]
MNTRRFLIRWLLLLSASSSLEADLIAYWSFDETSGGVAIDSVGGHHAVWQNGIRNNLQWTNGQIGGSANLGGQTAGSNFFATGNLSALANSSALSISAWINPDGFTGSTYEGIFMTRNSISGSAIGNRNWGIAWENGNASNPNPHLDSRTSAGFDSNPQSIPANGNWYHVALVWDGITGSHTQYINGIESASGNGPTGTISGGIWQIGHDDCCGGSRDFNGQIDDLGVWDHPLSPAEIQSIYNNGLKGFPLNESPPLPPTNPLEVGLVINEIHYDAEPKTEFVEFIEILNTNSSPLELSGSSFTNGISLTFPPGTTLQASEYAVITENATALAARFNLPAELQVFEYSGSLSNDGERIDFRDATGAIVDTVNYRAEFPWPISPNGEGDSMQLINATLDNDLAGAWRGDLPTPGLPNRNFSPTAPPLIRQVQHEPQQPLSTEPTVITAKITDPEGVGSATVLYQVVAPGDYIPAFLPKPYATLLANPDSPLQPNPAFEDPNRWVSLPMTATGNNDLFTAQIPPQAHRTLVRYRIVSEDIDGESIRVPYPKDPSLNFAYFVYDGVPDYLAGDTTHSSASLTTLPVHHMITRDDDRAYAYAYQSTGDNFRIPKGHPARKTYNWECALVYDGVVYDHVGWRLRQNNDRYTGNGKRSMRFRMNRGHYFQARGEDGQKLPIKWRRFSTSKMARFGGTNSYGFHETINSKLWRMVGVECPYFLPAHWRMIDDSAEAPDQFGGDFFGFATIMQDIDGRLLDERQLPNGNIYKLKDGVTNPAELQRNQHRLSVSDGSDYTNIRNNLDSSQSDTWLNEHVNWDQWARYHAVVEAVRHYDFGTPSSHFKNRAWYFQEEQGTPFGLLRIIPHDHDASWSRGYHDNLNSVGNSIGTGFPWAAVFDDIRRPPVGIEKTPFTREYRNFVREFRQLLWQEETVNAMIDDHATMLQSFTLADRDRWVGGPAREGRESMVPIEEVGASMKEMAFERDTMYGSELVGGRGAFLDQISADPEIPHQPTLSHTGSPSFPAGDIQLTSSSFSSHQGGASFAAMQWRIAEVSTSPERRFEWEATWDSGTIFDFEESITPPAIATRVGRIYRARVRHRDDVGHWSLWSEPLEFTASLPDLSIYTNSLVISEIMYHPAEPSPAEIAAGFDDDDLFEYLEIRNVGSQAVDLSNVRFTKGIDIDLSGIIAPGSRILVVNNRAAFEFRHGTGHPVLGEWTGKLDNGGERLKLSFGAGETILDFSYDDAGLWPEQPDGNGSSLVLRYPFSLPDHADPFSWRVGSPTPGTTDGLSFNPSDDLLTYAIQGSPQVKLLPGSVLSFEVEINELAEDLIMEIQSSQDLRNWETSSSITLSEIGPADTPGFVKATFLDSIPAMNDRHFLRLHVRTN